jgi:membrane fusion protein (multidrug efflux system)
MSRFRRDESRVISRSESSTHLCTGRWQTARLVLRPICSGISRSMYSHRSFAFILCLALAAVGFVGCGKQEANASVDAKPNAAAQTRTNGDRPGATDSNGGAANRGGAQRGGQQAAALVVTAPVTKAPFATEVEALGTAKANESIDVTAKVSNRVKAIRFREGQSVRAGDILVELDPEEIAADLAVAEAALKDSRSQVNRSRELYASKALSAQQMEQLESTMQANEARVAAARARLADQTVRAPFGGRVGLRNISVGGLVNPGTVITTLDDLSVMKVDFSVPETFLSILKEGLQIQANTTAYAGEPFIGTVLSVGSRVDPVSRSIVVRGQLVNREGKLKPGMFMTVRLQSANANALLIPEEALVPEREKQFVYVVRNNKAVKTEIAVGRRRPGEVEVLKGLELGDSVVVQGTQKVRDGGGVRVVNNRDEQ